MSIKKDFLHPENNPEDVIYPATSIDQVEGLNEKLTEIEQSIEDIPSGGGSGGSGLFVHTYSYNGEPRFKILTPISTNISPVGWNGVGLFTDTQKVLDGAVYYFVQGGGVNRREWQRAFNFTDDKGLTFVRISYNSSYEIAFLTDAIMDTQDLSEYVETIEPFTGGNM